MDGLVFWIALFLFAYLLKETQLFLILLLIFFTMLFISLKKMPKEQIGICTTKHKERIKTEEIAKKYVEARKEMRKINDDYTDYLKSEYPWKDIRPKEDCTFVYLNDGTYVIGGFVTWNERLQEIHVWSKYNARKSFSYDEVKSIVVK